MGLHGNTVLYARCPTETKKIPNVGVGVFQGPLENTKESSDSNILKRCVIYREDKFPTAQSYKSYILKAQNV